MTSIVLSAPGLASLPLDASQGYVVKLLDLGDAVTRDVVGDAPDADGTDDETEFIGARAVALKVRLLPRGGWLPAERARRLRAFTNPRLRPVMTISRDGEVDQQVVLRRGPFNNPIERPHFQDVTVQWVAPFGILESVALHDQTVFAVAAGAAVGRAYSLTFSRTYPASPVLGSGSFVNAGDTDAYPLIRIYGPVTEPVLDNLTQGKSLTFAALTLSATEYLEIDTRARTILLNADPTNSRYDKLVYPTSDWFTLGPGANAIRFHPATFTDGTTLAEFVWRDAYL